MNKLLIIFLLFLSATAQSQNLVPNGGFEDENICTEYEKNCAPEAWIATSLWANYYYYEATQHFVGLTVGSRITAGGRNFIRTRLLCGLRKGNQYKLEFYVRSLHNVLDSIGVYFSPNDFLFEKRNFKEIQPQLWSANALDTSIKDLSKWQKLQFTYTASGDEGYITIGCFKRDDYRNLNRPDYKTEYYFFLDDVSLIAMDPHEKLCIQADSVKKEIYAQNERHDMLSREIYYYRKNPPAAKPLPVTRIQKVQKIDTLIIPDIFFATASFQLSPKSYNMLDSFSNQLQKFSVDSVVIEGHTDNVGKLDYNQALSSNRAISVKNYLAEKIPALNERIITRGFAFLRPAASNNTVAGRQLNRRVEVFVYRKE